jgi:hypothetical protein
LIQLIHLQLLVLHYIGREPLAAEVVAQVIQAAVLVEVPGNMAVES